MRIRRGFTLIELLIVVVIIGILAAFAIPKFSYTKDKANAAKMKSDLRNMAEAQEAYFYENNTYASNAAVLAPSFVPSPGITLTVTASTASGWSAKATSAVMTTFCTIFYGSATPVAPATTEGVVACQ